MFTGFTLSQSGLVVHWWRRRPPGWQYRAVINGTGAVITAVATLVFLFTKFTEGAWVVVIAVPAFIFLFLRIHRYYKGVEQVLAIGQIPPKPCGLKSKVIVPVTGISRLTERALCEALSLSDEVVAVCVVLGRRGGGRQTGRGAAGGVEPSGTRAFPSKCCERSTRQ